MVRQEYLTAIPKGGHQATRGHPPDLSHGPLQTIVVSCLSGMEQAMGEEA
jgi:hypothetical protein